MTVSLKLGVDDSAMAGVGSLLAVSLAWSPQADSSPKAEIRAILISVFMGIDLNPETSTFTS